MATAIKATRMELLKLKKKIKLATKGHKLLKEKRDALISEFFKLVDDLKSLRVDMEEKLKIAFSSLILAQAVSGFEEVSLAADSVDSRMTLDAEKRAIMGVIVPVFSVEDSKAKERGYSLISTTVELDIAAKKFEESLQSIIKLAEVEATAVSLAEEIKKTKRKVNALERIVIPEIQISAKYITMRLEEMERENFSRLKIIKKRIDV